MELTQNDREHLQDMVQRGELTADQANVKKVLMRRVQLVTSKIPAQVRKALNDAVKRGELAHMQKDGHKPEVYYHPTFDYLARRERNEHERSVLQAVAGVMARRELPNIALTLKDVIPEQLRAVIPPEYQEALLAYAQSRGRDWNSKLREDFYNARDDRFPQYGGHLRQIRNHPVWHKAVYTEELADCEAQENTTLPSMKG